MKKNWNILLVIVLLGTSLSVTAQPDDRKDEKTVNWQVRGGIIWSNPLAVTNINSQTGVHIAGLADIALSRNHVWRLQTGLRYAQKGWKFSGYYGNEQIMAADYDTQLHYLELPLMAAVRLRLGKGAQLTIRQGFYGAYGLNGKTQMSIKDTDGSETFSRHFSKPCDFNGAAYDSENRRTAYPELRRWELGYAGGLDLTIGHVIIGAETAVGLTRLADKKIMGNSLANVLESVILSGGEPRNFTFSITAGYQF